VPSVNHVVETKNRVRIRLLVGALLLFSAVLTWFIGLTSVHSRAVIAGTEHVRETVVTFKRNGATGTLILCSISALLLFPILQPRRPVRDGALIILFALLAGSSVYTLLSLRPLPAGSPQFDANLATEVASDSNSSGSLMDFQPTKTLRTVPPLGNQLRAQGVTSNTRSRSADLDDSAQNPDRTDEGSSPAEDQPSNGDSDENQTELL
jgi:hypothetical protein